MKSRIKIMWLHLFALLFVVSVAHAQPAQQAQSNFSQPELDQMLAPVALYPDALLSQVLMASTYPAEVAEASQWVKANPSYKGEAAVKAAQNQPWDISVKSLLPFPQVLSTMEAKQDWTTNLGNAFLGQQQQVMDTIQSLRRKAMQAGYLKTDNRVQVVDQDQLVSINLVQPTAVYVPYYNPTVVYGTWWAPAYAPVYWDPWPGYTVHPGYGWAWAPAATIITVGVLYGAFNWRSRNMYYGRHVGYWRGYRGYNNYRSGGHWRHNPAHRGHVAYRHNTVNKRYGHTARTTGRGVHGKAAPGRTVHRTPTGRTVKRATPTGRTVNRTTTTRRTTGARGNTVKTRTTTRTVRPATRTGTPARTAPRTVHRPAARASKH